MSIFAKTQRATPLLNTPHFHKVFTYPLPLDNQGLLRATELIVLPETPFKVLKWLDNHICEVSMEAYPGQPLYADRRFLSFSNTPFPHPHRKLSSKEVLINRLLARVGVPYIWGGNWSDGIPDLLTLYPPQNNLDPSVKDKYVLRGVDCSGLLYEAADGLVPRNTSDLYAFGQGVKIANLDPESIAKQLEPLDFLVWKNHLIIVLDNQRSIESHKDHGVIVSDLTTRLTALLKTLTPTDDILYSRTHLVAKRWYDSLALSCKNNGA